MRIYQAVPENLPAFNEFFRRWLLPLQQRHGARLVGRWESEDGRVVAVWEYDDRAAYQRIESAVRRDPDLILAQQHRALLPPIITSKEEVFMSDTLPPGAAALRGNDGIRGSGNRPAADRGGPAGGGPDLPGGVRHLPRRGRAGDVLRRRGHGGHPVAGRPVVGTGRRDRRQARGLQFRHPLGQRRVLRPALRRPRVLGPGCGPALAGADDGDDRFVGSAVGWAVYLRGQREARRAVPVVRVPAE